MRCACRRRTSLTASFMETPYPAHLRNL
jgi:hypothetical protein